VERLSSRATSPTTRISHLLPSVTILRKIALDHLMINENSYHLRELA
jgi:hypothetical protein